MTRALPKKREIPSIKGSAANKGLVYNKFFDAWPDVFLSSDCSEQKDDDLTGMKTTWVNKFNFMVDGAGPLAERQKTMVASLGGKTGLFKLTSPFVTGMGLAHPIENGFAWHHILGVPYLAGSSLKGLTRAWAQYWADGDMDDKLITVLFGPDKPDKSDKPDNSDKLEEDGTGDLIFFDCLPVSSVQLMPEVMTPHIGDWRIANAAKRLLGHTPADWVNPVPIPFLTLKPGAEFQISIASRSADQSHVEKGFTLIKQALSELGAGAKTATGFGRLEITGADDPTLREGSYVCINKNASEARYVGRIGKINKIVSHAGKQFAQITPTDGAGKIKGTFELEVLDKIPPPDDGA